MKILLVNDDGIRAEGLKAIAKELSLKHEVFIVAPMTEQSGMSQALTMGVPLRVETGFDYGCSFACRNCGYEDEKCNGLCCGRNTSRLY